MQSLRSASVCRIETLRQRAGGNTHENVEILFGRALDEQDQGLRTSEGCLEMRAAEVWMCECKCVPTQ